MKNITTIFATLILMASSAALAQEAPSFDEVDTSGDGYVSRSELQAAGVDINIEDADTDGDGMLNEDEYDSAVSDA